MSITGLPKEPVLITRPLLPKLNEYTDQLSDIWESRWLSNGGDKHKELEAKLKNFMNVPNLSLFNNGTIALLTAIQSLRLQGEVITTPFSFPATSHVLAWNNITPVFCDIDPVRLTIDPNHIEQLITAKTTAILGVHVYGVPCHVQEIQEIADRNGLKVIYDAAHAFSTEIEGKSIGEFGDISMFSFHATKLFHTGEGGALTYNDPNLKQRIDYLKNFGIKNKEEVIMPGINGNMNELSASLGLEVLPLVREEQAKRQKLRDIYTDTLNKLPGITLIDVPEGTSRSYQYFAIRINEEKFGTSRNALYDHLCNHDIEARKYFYPLISDYPCYHALTSARSRYLPEATKAAEEILCLPFYGGLGEKTVKNILYIISCLN